MSGAIPLIPLYTFTACMGITFIIFLICLVSLIFLLFTFTLEVKMKSGLIWCWISKDSTFQNVPSFYVCMKQKQTDTNEQLLSDKKLCSN
jgi:hypothetical protein